MTHCGVVGKREPAFVPDSEYACCCCRVKNFNMIVYGSSSQTFFARYSCWVSFVYVFFHYVIIFNIVINTFFKKCAKWV